MGKPLLSIVCATFDDHFGVHLTLNTLRLYDRDALRHCEIVVVDNHPDSPHGEENRNYLRHVREVPCRYVPMPSPVGTSAPRERAIQEAAGEAVLCVDCHVQLAPGALNRLLLHYATDASPDLFSGPWMYDDLNPRNVLTHFEDAWRGQMWGVGWHDPREEPFEIFGMGLGLFTCRKAAWPGFNPKFRGFGGEEGYVHEKFRRLGRRCVCLPWLLWSHRWGKPYGTPFPLNTWAKARNHVIGLTELGIPLDRARQHFVYGVDENGPGQPNTQGAATVPVAEWELLTADPADPPLWPPGQAVPAELRDEVAARTRRQAPPAAGVPVAAFAPAVRPAAVTVPATVAAPAPPAPCREKAEAMLTLDRLYESIRRQPGGEHCPALRQLATGAGVVVSLGPQVGPEAFALLAGQPDELVLVSPTPPPPIVKILADRAGRTKFTYRQEPAVPECDLLVLECPADADALAAVAAKSRGTLALRGTASGPRQAAARAMAGRGWHLMSQVDDAGGLTVLSRTPPGQPPPGQPPAVPQATVAPASPPQPPAAVPVAIPAEGPGTELKAMLAALGIAEKPGCDCNQKCSQMNLWGVQGCRDNFNTIVGWMRDGMQRWGWAEKVAAAARAVTTGLAFQVSWSDPFPSLINECIRRAEAKGVK